MQENNRASVCKQSKYDGRGLLSDMSVLIVDDVLPYAQYLAELASRLGAEVGIAGTGTEAVEKISGAVSSQAKHKRIRVALVDIMLPDLDGISVAKQLLGIDPELKLLFTSAGSPDLEAHNIPNAGFLKKPFRPEILAERLGALAGSDVLTNGAAYESPSIVTVPLAGRYLALLRDQYAEALAAFHRKDYSTLATLAHKLKGSAPLYGYDELGSIADGLERTLKSEDGATALKRSASSGFLERLHAIIRL
jgi:CheY-like chemotaxis protein